MNATHNQGTPQAIPAMLTLQSEREFALSLLTSINKLLIWSAKNGVELPEYIHTVGDNQAVARNHINAISTDNTIGSLASMCADFASKLSDRIKEDGNLMGNKNVAYPLHHLH